MPIATLTSKGQVTLPAAMRRKLRLVAGSKIAFEERPDGSFIVRQNAGDIRELKGLLKVKGGQAMTVEEMDEAIAAAVTERVDRRR